MDTPFYQRCGPCSLPLPLSTCPPHHCCCYHDRHYSKCITHYPYIPEHQRYLDQCGCLGEGYHHHFNHGHQLFDRAFIAAQDRLQKEIEERLKDTKRGQMEREKDAARGMKVREEEEKQRKARELREEARERREERFEQIKHWEEEERGRGRWPGRHLDEDSSEWRSVKVRTERKKRESSYVRPWNRPRRGSASSWDSCFSNESWTRTESFWKRR